MCMYITYICIYAYYTTHTQILHMLSTWFIPHIHFLRTHTHIYIYVYLYIHIFCCILTISKTNPIWIKFNPIYLSIYRFIYLSIYNLFIIYLLFIIDLFIYLFIYYQFIYLFIIYLLIYRSIYSNLT